jgi:hypothetical protein
MQAPRTRSGSVSEAASAARVDAGPEPARRENDGSLKGLVRVMTATIAEKSARVA